MAEVPWWFRSWLLCTGCAWSRARSLPWLSRDQKGQPSSSVVSGARGGPWHGELGWWWPQAWTAPSFFFPSPGAQGVLSVGLSFESVSQALEMGGPTESMWTCLGSPGWLQDSPSIQSKRLASTFSQGFSSQPAQ